MERDGVALPVEMVERPKLKKNLLGYLEAFYDLDTERHHGQGLMRIPWSKIVNYARYYGMNVEETVFFIRRMDDAHIAKLAKRSTDTNGTGSPGVSEVVRRSPRPD